MLAVIAAALAAVITAIIGAAWTHRQASTNWEEIKKLQKLDETE